MLTSQMLRRWTLRGFTYFGLTFYSQGVIAAIQAIHGDVARTVAGETNLSSTLAQSLILAGLAVAVVRQPHRYWRLCPPLWPLLCIAALALLSVLWSENPGRTLRRAVALSECMLFGMFLYRTDGLERTIERIGQVCVAMAALSLVVFIAVPSVGRETALGYERALRGVFPQKNTMAECMLLGMCCYAYRSLRGLDWRSVGALGLLGLCVLLGRGASVLMVAGVVGVMTLWLRLNGLPVLRLGLLFVLVWAGVALVVALVGFPEEVFALAGRDMSLTGRVPLWEAILPEIWRAPLWGHGYAGFWNVGSPTVQMIWRFAGWEAPDAHCSYLDILLQLGGVGLLLYVCAWSTLFRRAWVAGRDRFEPATFVWMYGVALLLIGTDEGVIPIPNLWTALLPVALLALSRHLALTRPGRQTVRGLHYA